MKRFLLSLVLVALSCPGLSGQGILAPGFGIPSGDGRRINIEDVDLDGDPDLIIFGEATFSVIRNLGNLAFAPRVVWPLTVEATDGAGVGDIDGDGDVDVLSLVQGNTGAIILYASRNAGDGTFLPPTMTPITNLGNAIDVVFGDFNGDGRTDAVFVTSSGQVTTILNTGTGSFFSGPTSNISQNLDVPAIGDVDGDGDNDIAVGSGSNVLILRNNGFGSFSQGPLVSLNGLPRSTVLFDLDGDMDLDLVTSRFISSSMPVGQQSQIRSFLNNGTGTYSALYTVPVQRADSLAVADLDLDGLAEVVAIQTIPSVVLVVGGVSQAVDQVLATGDNPLFVAAGDLDGDGAPEVAAPCAFDNETFIFRNLLAPMPPSIPYPGTGEDLALSSGVDAAPTTGPGQSIKTAGPGSLVQIGIASPGGLFDLQPYLLVADLVPTGMPATPPPGLPWLHLSVPGFVVLVDGAAPGPFAPVILPSGSVLPFVTPPGLAGQSAIFQGAALSPMAQNGVFAVSDGHEIQFVP